MLGEARKATAALEAAVDVEALLTAAAGQIRRLTGFDRVMIYRFLPDGAGAVVAEEKVADLPSFLNHHYPASDIPKQARALYLRNPIRVIPDVYYTPAPLTAAPGGTNRGPLDMSECVLRSVSPVHIQYLKNMAVAASMSVSIIVSGVLWGLIACHHRSPRRVAYEMRELARHIGRMLSLQIETREEVALHRETAMLERRRDHVIADVARAKDVEGALFAHCDAVVSIVAADGGAVVMGDQIAAYGRTPTDAQIRELAVWLTDQEDLFASHSLALKHEPAGAYADIGSGLLSARVGGETAIQLLWFRAEQIEIVNWAGNPHRPVEPGETLTDLTPRKSFEVWKETVRLQARPWSVAEIDAVQRFSLALFDLRRERTLRELNIQLRRTLAEKETLLAQKDLLMLEVNHRVQNSLQLVNAMLRLQASHAEDARVQDLFEEASHRVMAISALHGRLWKSDQIETVDLCAYFSELGEGLADTWDEAWRPYLKVSGARVLAPTSTAVVLGLLVTELLTNAVKYAYGGAAGPIEVLVKNASGGRVRVSVRDFGVGMSEGGKVGLGSRLLQTLIAQLHGEVEIKSGVEGTEVVLLAPVSTPATAA
jgi:light-regulated signal transduction histidine kinase (bacteriophytochrome)